MDCAATDETVAENDAVEEGTSYPAEYGQTEHRAGNSFARFLRSVDSIRVDIRTAKALRPTTFEPLEPHL